MLDRYNGYLIVIRSMGDGGGGHWLLVRMVGVSASVNLPLHHKAQKFSSGTSSPGWSRKKGRKTVVVVNSDTTYHSLL